MIRYQLTHRPADPDVPPDAKPDPGRWVVTRRDGDRSEDLTSFTAAPADVALAQSFAIDYLRGHQVRAIRWERPWDADTDTGDLIFEAITAEPMGAWTVLAYRDRDGAVWRVTPSGAYLSGGRRVDSEADLRRLAGPLEPVEIHNVAALVAEVLMFRAVTLYKTGLAACLWEWDCDEYTEADDRGETLEECSHVTTEIATARDALRLRRVERALNALEFDAKTVEDNPDRYSMGDLNEKLGVKQAVTTIREAMDRDDDD